MENARKSDDDFREVVAAVNTPLPDEYQKRLPGPCEITLQITGETARSICMLVEAMHVNPRDVLAIWIECGLRGSLDRVNLIGDTIDARERHQARLRRARKKT